MFVVPLTIITAYIDEVLADGGGTSIIAVSL